ncbi:MAG: hypothetical protein BGO26_12330 [Actinobacteria bacterium 69-20]|nr:ATP-binding protein [Actinomycetota bacterium]OJV26664.1 MAG: hypothetical protein BGO26_12330 [Actinobacteria bacterium 69-20]
MVTSIPDTTVNAGAEKRFFIEMLTKDIELLPAIVDLVDNSVDGARGLHPDGDLDGQWVKIKVKDDSFTISDNSGGISVDIARHYAFRFGRSKDFTGVKRSVGQFGVGMKRAIFKIGQAFTVKSAHRGETGGSDSSRFDMSVDVEEWAVQEAWTFEFGNVQEGITLAAGEETGTTITITKLHPSVQDDLNDPSVAQLLRTELRVRHQESIQSGLKLYLNSETPLVASRPSLQASAVVRPVYKQFQVEALGGTVDVKLYAGTVAPPKRDKDTDPEDDGRAENFQDPGDAGWYLFCNDRLLLVADRTPITGWGNPAAAYHPQYRLFRGFVYLSADDASLLPWNTTKTAVDRDSPVFRAVQSEMKTTLVAVQAVINRAKQVRARLDEEETKPEILVALDETPDQPISSLTTVSSQMLAPASPPPKPHTPATPKIQRIQYTVERDRYKEVAEALGASSGSEVGRLTFDYFYDQEID